MATSSVRVSCGASGSSQGRKPSQGRPQGPGGRQEAGQEGSKRNSRSRNRMQGTRGAKVCSRSRGTSSRSRRYLLELSVILICSAVDSSIVSTVFMAAAAGLRLSCSAAVILSAVPSWLIGNLLMAD